jgi:hypothetical protein
MRSNHLITKCTNQVLSVISLQSGHISRCISSKKTWLLYQLHEKMSSFKLAKGCEEFGLQDWPVCWSAELLHPK